MRVILDECMPRRLALELVGHSVSTVAQAGWSGFSNGELLARIHGTFDAFITVDKNLPVQQKNAMLSFGVIVIRTSSNALDSLRPLVPKILTALQSLQPGQVVILPPGA